MARSATRPPLVAARASGDVEEKARERWAPLRRLFWVPSAPVNLAILRVVVFGTLAVLAVTSRAATFSRLPDSLLVPPHQLGGLLEVLPRQSGVVSAATWVLVAACLCAVVGWRSRITMAAASLFALYVLGIAQLYGKVDHYHHVVWLAILLTCSSSADALALDARGRPTPPASVRYGFPLRIAWLLIGCCYFFPGLAKLSEWDTWLRADNLRGLLNVQQWAAHGGVAVPERLLLPAAVFTLVFEVGFVFAVFNRRLRPWAIVAGLGFHLATFVTMGILFTPLWVCYVAFVDWSRWFKCPDGEGTDTPGRATLAVSAVLVPCVLIAGLGLVMNAWPFACYPTFVGDYAGRDEAVTPRIVAVVDGRSEPVPLFDWMPTSRRAAVTWNAMRYPAVLAELGHELVPDASSIQVWRVVESAQADDRGRVISRSRMLEVRF